MNEKPWLQHIESIIKKEGFDALFIEPSDNNPWGSLLLYAGKDEQNRERLVEISAKEQEMGQGLSDEPLPRYFYLSFNVKLPLECKKENLYELGSAILWLNRTLDLPGFELSEFEARPLYRYVYLSPEDIDKKILMSLCGAITLYVFLYSSLLENICNGTKSFRQTLEEILELTK